MSFQHYQKTGTYEILRYEGSSDDGDRSEQKRRIQRLKNGVATEAAKIRYEEDTQPTKSTDTTPTDEVQA